MTSDATDRPAPSCSNCGGPTKHASWSECVGWLAAEVRSLRSETAALEAKNAAGVEGFFAALRRETARLEANSSATLTGSPAPGSSRPLASGWVRVPRLVSVSCSLHSGTRAEYHKHNTTNASGDHFACSECAPLAGVFASAPPPAESGEARAVIEPGSRWHDFHGYTAKVESVSEHAPMVRYRFENLARDERLRTDGLADFLLRWRPLNPAPNSSRTLTGSPAPAVPVVEPRASNGDPAEVTCPRCRRAPGMLCRDPLGQARDYHAERIQAAQSPAPAVPQGAETVSHESAAFAIDRVYVSRPTPTDANLELLRQYIREQEQRERGARDQENERLAQAWDEAKAVGRASRDKEVAGLRAELTAAINAMAAARRKAQDAESARDLDRWIGMERAADLPPGGLLHRLYLRCKDRDGDVARLTRELASRDKEVAELRAALKEMADDEPEAKAACLAENARLRAELEAAKREVVLLESDVRELRAEVKGYRDVFAAAEPDGDHETMRCGACTRGDHANCSGWCFCAIGCRDKTREQLASLRAGAGVSEVVRTAKLHDVRDIASHIGRHEDCWHCEYVNAMSGAFGMTYWDWQAKAKKAVARIESAAQPTGDTKGGSP